MFFRYPLFLPALGFSLGIFSASIHEISPVDYLALRLMTILLGLGTFWPRWKNGFYSVLLFGFFLGLGVLLIGAHFFRPIPEPLKSWTGQKSAVNILIEAGDYCQSKGQSSSFPARLMGWFEGDRFHPMDMGIRVAIGSPTCRVAPGGLYRTLAKFRAPRRFKNPSSFDYGRYLRARGEWATAHVEGEEWVVLWRRPNRFIQWVYRLRENILQGMEEGIQNPSARGVLAAMLFRETDSLSPEIEENFRRGGVSHVLVVSGLNLTLVYLFFFLAGYFVISFWRRGGESGFSKKITMSIAAIPTVLYMGVVGFSPPVLRSGVFACCAVWVGLSDWRKDPCSIFLLAYLGLLLWNPLYLFDLSFQLSFLCVGTLLVFVPRFLLLLKRWGEDLPWLLWIPIQWILALLGSTIAINGVLYPLIAGSFHEASLVAPLANLLMVPVMTFVILPGGMLGAIGILVAPPVGRSIFHGLEEITKLHLTALDWLVSFPFASVMVSSPGIFTWLIYLFFLYLLFRLGNWGYRTLLLFISVWIIFGFGWGITEDFFPRASFQLTMLDVGQGESIILRSPAGKNYLIDGGGFPYSDFDVGRNVVAPALLDQGIRRIEAVVMTHLDADHAKGLKFIMERFTVGSIWIPAGLTEQEAWAPFGKIASGREIPLKTLSRGDRWKEGGLDFHVLWPSPELLQTLGEDFSNNNQSLVLKVCEDENCVLLTGDIEREAEQILVASGSDLASQILKAPHHGSRTSSTEEFLRKVQPRLVLISAGEGNRFGFPHLEVLENLRLGGAKILRTDLHGQITITPGEIFPNP